MGRGGPAACHDQRGETRACHARRHRLPRAQLRFGEDWCVLRRAHRIRGLIAHPGRPQVDGWRFGLWSYAHGEMTAVLYVFSSCGVRVAAGIAVLIPR
jgi:hypothetical protein